MTKEAFLAKLSQRLSGLPAEIIAEQCNFYSEMIEDRMEEGALEEAAVEAMGDVEDIAAQVMEMVPSDAIVKAYVEPVRGMKAWEWMALILGAPLWMSLLLAAGAVALSLFLSIWSVIIACWAVACSVAGCALGSLIFGFGCMVRGINLQALPCLVPASVAWGSLSLLFADARV